MTDSITAMPPAPDPTGPSTTPATSWVDATWAQITGVLDTVPTLAWVAALAALTAVTLLAVPLLRTQAFKAGTRHGKKALTDEERRDRRLLVAAMIPASLFWIAVLVGSGRGLIAFGREDLNWHNGWEFLVPFTLDGVAISFALLAFRAVKKNLNPDRAVRIAGLAMVASAGINFLHEVGGSKLGAGYLAILSLLGMLIFDELLGQFELGADVDVRRKNPKFGLRWLTWPTNTVCAWVAWRNHPDETLKATVGNAVRHLEKVRRNKATKHAAEIDTPAWWFRFAPWAHVGALRAALTEQRSARTAERTARENLSTDLLRVRAEHDDELRQQAEAHRSELERERSDKAEQIARLQAEHAAHVSRIREKSTNAPSATPPRSSGKAAPTNAGTEQRLTNDEAIALMLRTHPERDHQWGPREVRDLTGAGFGRISKLIAAVAEHHARSSGAAGRSTPDDAAKEHSA